MANDTEHFIEWLRAGAPEGTLAEVRVKPVQFKGRTPAVRVGFFDQPGRGARASWWWGEGRAQVYAGLHPRRADVTDTPNPQQLQKAVPPVRAGNAEDIVAMTHVLLDFDPVRDPSAKGQPSSAEELERAHQVALSCDAWLREQGFHVPLANLSGNGYHLLMTMPPQDPVTFPPLLRAFLHEMAGMFSTEEVDIDTSVYDAPRICKVPGTISVKGDNSSAERPWRRARILRWSEPVPDEKLAEHILSLPPIVEVREESADGQPREVIRLGDNDRRHPEHEMDYVLERCAFLRHAKADAKTLPEPQWFALVSNLLTFENGEQVIHELSKPYPKYSAEETDAKIAHALRSSPGPHRCDHIASVGWRCPYIDNCPANAPASLAIRDAPRSTDELDMADETRMATLDGVPDEIREILATTPPTEDEARAPLVARAVRSLVGHARWSLWMALDAIGFSPHGTDRPRAVIRSWAVAGLEDEAKAVPVPPEADVAGAEAILSDLPGAYLARLLEGDMGERIGVLIDMAQAGAPSATVLGASLLGDGGADDFRTAMTILNGGVSR